MTPKRKKSRILEEMHKTAKRLYKIGLMDKSKIEKYDLLCLEPAWIILPEQSRRKKILKNQ